MLNHPWIIAHRQACHSSVLHLANRPVASLLTIFALALTLTLPTLFYVLADNFHKTSQHWQSNDQMTLYLQSNLSKDNIFATHEAVKALKQVAETKLISAEQGMNILQKQPGMSQAMAYLTQNPLPAAIQVTPNKGVNSPLSLNQLKVQLASLAHVDQVSLDQAWISQLHHLSKLIKGTTEIIFLLLIFAVVLIVVNTLRLDIRNRFEEIQVMTLIGATNGYIARPFLYTGFYYGFAAGILAMLTINIALSLMATLVNQLAASYQIQYTLYGLNPTESVALLVCSGGLGWMGAKIAIHNQLKDIKPAQLMQI